MGIFGGGDGGASELASAQMQAQQMAMQQQQQNFEMQRRWQNEDRERQENWEREQAKALQAQADKAAADAAAQKAKDDAQVQSKNVASTIGQDSINAYQVAALSKPNSQYNAGLPGFSTLQNQQALDANKKKQGQAGYAGQGNTLGALAGINPRFGGGTTGGV